MWRLVEQEANEQWLGSALTPRRASMRRNARHHRDGSPSTLERKRPRSSIAGRASWSCSKQLAHPNGAIQGFIGHANLERAAALPV